MRLPKRKEEIYEYKINWNTLFKYDIIEKVGRPLIGKQIKKLLGVEDQNVISFIVKFINQKCTPIQLEGKVKIMLEAYTEEVS